MGRMKEYMMELAERKGVEFEEITNEDMQMDFMMKAQVAFANPDTPQDELKKWKDYLPVKSYNEVKFYDAETGTPKFKVGDVMMDGKGFCYLIK
jgi:hypothetical protein